MGSNRIKVNSYDRPAWRWLAGRMSVCSMMVALSACATTAQNTHQNKEPAREIYKTNPSPALVAPKTPQIVPWSENISPLRTKYVTVTARNTPLGDVLHVIAEASGLNLLIHQGVLLDLPITLTLRNVTCENALETVFSSTDYFYGIQDNMLKVEASTTKIFELGHPALVQNYSIAVGGDILSSAVSSATGSSAKTIAGTAENSAKSDAKTADFWDSLEKSLQSILRIKPEASRSGVAGAASSHTDGVSAESGHQSPSLTAGTQEQNVSVNRLTGTIVVTGNRRTIQVAENYLNAVRDALHRQVLVEARVIEVQWNNSLQYGIDWSFLGDVKNIGNVASGFGEAMSNGLSDAANAAAPAFRLGVGRTDFTSLLSALKQQGDVKTLSNPRIHVMNGQSALLTVGRNYGFISKVSSTYTTVAGSAPTVTFNVETGNVLSGMLLGIVPYINAQGEITITVTPILSDLVELAEKKVGSSTSDQVVLSIPTIDLRELSTTVKARGGEMIILGGLITKKDSRKDDKIPILGDIPWLGNLLFTHTTRQEIRSELVVALQPSLISGVDLTPVAFDEKGEHHGDYSTYR